MKYKTEGLFHCRMHSGIFLKSEKIYVFPQRIKIMDISKLFSIKILPDGKIIRVPKNYNLRQALLENGLNIDSSCGGAGTCGRCRVRIASGKVHAVPGKKISKREMEKGFILSCSAEVKGDIEVIIPQVKKRKAKIEAGLQELPEGKIYKSIDKTEIAKTKINPWILKEKITVEKPTIFYSTSDLFRLKKSILEKTGVKDIKVPLNILKNLPFLLRENNWEVMVVLNRETGTLIKIQPASERVSFYGLALDIGTTTLAMHLVDLLTSEIAGSASEYNPQIKYGEDIINRIVYSLKKDGLEELHDSVIGAINELILKLLKDSGVSGDDVSVMMVSGNSTMIHLFYGVPPKFIREEPYVTVANKFLNVSAGELGIKYIGEAEVYSIEGVASYLGGDITSGVLATNLSGRKKLSLFLDLGTNGELVVGNSQWMIGCSCSAGPAFEGGGVKCGVRAVEGAIEKVVITEKDYRCSYEVIGEERPVGICGSGLIDLLGEMYLRGVIDRKGKFNKDIGNSYLRFEDEEYRYIVAERKDSAAEKDIFITEVDINNLIRAKAAVYSGIKTLLEEVDLNIADIDRVFLAGGLGKNINVQSAIVIGMLPDIDLNRYSFLGNTSVTGAYLCLLSNEKYRLTEKIANKITYLELSVNMKFMDRYIAGLFLPNTDLKDFPTVERLLYSL
ncbi:MAG: DUF4445 domain-containing protein [Actinobacteria bacterium]|nr:DUF4445 domain-containing protein [Actinomycetota bacterium]